KHRTSDVEEAVGDRSQRTAVTVTSASQCGVFGSASGVMLRGDAGPMVDGLGEPRVAGITPDNGAALTGALGNRRGSCQTAQGGVVTSPQSIVGFCQQRGEDDPSHSRQGCEDLRVMLLVLPRRGLLRWSEAGDQAVEPLVRLFDLTIHQADARNERGD